MREKLTTSFFEPGRRCLTSISWRAHRVYLAQRPCSASSAPCSFSSRAASFSSLSRCFLASLAAAAASLAAACTRNACVLRALKPDAVHQPAHLTAG